MMSPDVKADAARSPTFPDGMSNGQIKMIGTKHQPRKTPTLPRSVYRRSGAIRAQPYALRIARQSQPTFFIDHDLVVQAENSPLQPRTSLLLSGADRQLLDSCLMPMRSAP